jgi:acyl phosphate:glycerol-3-phosphate acyltransferase
VTFAAIVIGGYLLGSCPWGYWLVRVFRHEDVRKHGSGSIGASNVWRTYGRGLGFPVVVLDTLKGFIPALVGVLAVSHLCGILAGAAAMLGHARPIWLRFEKGGKMVATGGGVIFAVEPLAASAVAVIWLTTFLATRYTSVASILSAIALPIASVVAGYPWPVIVFSVVTGLTVVFLHRANLQRLRRGTEHRFRLRRAAAQS